MIKIVREPSDTPNIQNTDDFIGLRHSYGDYNGYVDKKGQMLGYQVNGSTFTVLSGRAVVNGVEVDIDANGASITIDNVSTLQYHKLYLRVNLATMKADLYDYIGLLAGPTSDDLTLNTSGRAYLHLYSFTSKNGVISLITKQVKKIATLKEVISGDVPVEESHKINGLAITRNENGVLKCDGSIIPQRRLLFSAYENGNKNYSKKIGSLTFLDLLTTDHSLDNSSLEFVTTHGIFKIRGYVGESLGASSLSYFIYNVLKPGVGVKNHFSIAYAEIRLSHTEGGSKIQGRAISCHVDLSDDTVDLFAADSVNNNELGIYEIYEIIE